MKKGISPLIASVLLIAFTMSIAVVAGPWMSNLMSITQGEQDQRVNELVEASSTSLSIQNVDKSSSKAEVTLQNSGNQNLENYTVTVYCNEPIQEKYSEVIESLEVKEKQIDGCEGGIERVEIYSDNLPVKDIEDYSNEEITSSATISVSGASEWPTFHQNNPNTGTGSTDVESASEPLNLSWNYSTPGKVDSAPSVVENVTYVGSSGGDMFYAFNASNGEKIWNYSSGAVKSSPAIVDGNVYTGASLTKIFAFDASTGSKLWEFDTGGEVEAAPTVVNDKVYVGSWGGKFYALNAKDGSVSWKKDLRSSTYVSSDATFEDGKIYFGTTNDNENIIALNATSGNLIWNNTIGQGVSTGPVVKDDQMFVSNTVLHKLNSSNGDKLWNYTTSNDILSNPALKGDKVFVADKDGFLYSINVSTGDKIWESSTGSMYPSSPSVAEGKVYIGNNNDLLVYNASTGNEIDRYNIGDRVFTASISNGKVFVGSHDSKVYAFE